MRSIKYFVCVCLLLSACGCGTEKQPGVSININLLENVLTLENTFGSENLPDEFLLVRPGVLTVDSEENIYLFDEQRVKVYDKNGKAKKIIGGPGQGFGEFPGRTTGSITAGPTGYIAASLGHSKRYNIYNPEYKFLTIVNTSSFITRTYWSCKTFAFSENEYIAEVYGENVKDELQITTFTLEYVKGDEKIPVASYDIATQVVTGNSFMSLPFQGDLFWDMVSEHEVAYTHSCQDEIVSDAGSFYTVHIYDLNTGESKEIKQAYLPVPFEKDGKAGPRYQVFGGRAGEKKILERKKEQYIKEHPVNHYEAFKNVHFDEYIMFGVTNNQRVKNNSIESRIDIVNLKENAYIGSFYCPDISRLRTIKNGYAYKTGEDKEGFSIIEKYKIDPAVYGK